MVGTCQGQSLHLDAVYWLNFATCPRASQHILILIPYKYNTIVRSVRVKLVLDQQKGIGVLDSIKKKINSPLYHNDHLSWQNLVIVDHNIKPMHCHGVKWIWTHSNRQMIETVLTWVSVPQLLAGLVQRIAFSQWIQDCPGTSVRRHACKYLSFSTEVCFVSPSK